MRLVAVAGSAVLVFAVLAQSVLAGPALPITKPDVQPIDSGTGPAIDPNALQGQWFSNSGGQSYALPYEFSDNIAGCGGSNLNQPTSGLGSYEAIYGKVTHITYDEQGKITGFTIRAQITNDTPWRNGPWYAGQNSLGEWTTSPPSRVPSDSHSPPVYDTRVPYVGNFFHTTLTAEFALSSLNSIPNSWTSPYQQGQLPLILAGNADAAGWYGWTPSGSNSPAGSFSVPAWNFGNIPMGQCVQEDLTFTVTGDGLVSSDPRFSNLVNSYNAEWGQGDIFFNRTTDLKIGDWLDNLDSIDTGEAYPNDPLTGGNVSVFFTNVSDAPEPSSMVLLAIGFGSALAYAWRQRRQA